MPTFQVMPEGTVCNNTALLTFKKGAFKDFRPVKITGVKFNQKKWVPYDDWMNPVIILFMFTANWINNMDVYEIEGVYDPKHLNLDYNDENAWKVYAEKCRTIMSKLLDLPTTEFGARNFFEFKEIYRDQVKRIKSKFYAKNMDRAEEMYKTGKK